MGEPVHSEDSPDLVVAVEEAVGIVRLNRPDRGNSVTPDVVTRMGDAVEALAEDDAIRAVVLTGTGSVFCAGADVREMYAVYRTDGADGLMGYLADPWMPAVQRTVRKLWGAPVPVVAAYNGAATAGGLDFGLACDTRVASVDARFAESYVHLGMVPVAGGAYLLPLLIGLSAASRLIASGEFVSAPAALELGLVDEVCQPDDLLERAIAMARSMSSGPAATFVHAKRIARARDSVDLETALLSSLEANIALLARPEVRERVLAVMERYSRSTTRSSASAARP